MRNQQLFEVPFTSKIRTNSCSSNAGAGKCMCKQCREDMLLPSHLAYSKPKYETQWLFEAPLATDSTEVREYSPYYSPQSTLKRSQLVALKSSRFRNDPRLQAAVNNTPPLRIGERGVAVQKLQKALIDLGFPMPITTRRGTVDGIYGAETAATVRKFQAKHKLKLDGVAGRQTLSKLDQLFAPSLEPKCGAPQAMLQTSRFEDVRLEESAKAVVVQPKLCLFAQDKTNGTFFKSGAERWAKRIKAVAASSCSKIGSTAFESGSDILLAFKAAVDCSGGKLKEVHVFSHMFPEGIIGREDWSGLYSTDPVPHDGRSIVLDRSIGARTVADIRTDLLASDVVFVLHGCRAADGCKQTSNFARALFEHLVKDLPEAKVYGHPQSGCAGQDRCWCEYSKSYPNGRKLVTIPYYGGNDGKVCRSGYKC